MRKKVKLSKQVPVIESFFILALIYQLEKKWEENTRLQDEKKRSEILIQHLLENLQALESEEQESTPLSGDKRYLVVRWIYALFGLVLTPDFYSDIYDFTQIFCRYLLKNWDLWSGQSRVQLMFFPQHSKFTQCTMRFRKKRAKNVQL